MNKKMTAFYLIMIVGFFNTTKTSSHKLNQDTQKLIKNTDIESLTQQKIKEINNRMDNSTICRIAYCRIKPHDEDTNTSCIAIKCNNCTNTTQSILDITCCIPQALGMCLCLPCLPTYLIYEQIKYQSALSNARFDLMNKRVDELENIHTPQSITSIVESGSRLSTVNEDD